MIFKLGQKNKVLLNVVFKTQGKQVETKNIKSWAKTEQMSANRKQGKCDLLG